MHPSEADDLDFDEVNEAHLARHNVSPVEAFEVFGNLPTYRPNRRGLTATWLMLGETNGGRVLTIAVLCLEVQSRLRPITGWDSTDQELTHRHRKGGR